MGWGPARLLDFIERGAGQAAADCTTKGIQNLVLLVGTSGAHGYPHFMFPHPDSFTADGRYSETMGVHFMQNTAQGGTPSTFGGALLKATDYNNMPRASRFKRVYGVDNQAFGGYMSTDANSKTHDTTYWGATRVPTNADLPIDKKFLIQTNETPWLAKYGLKKAITGIDGGGINPFHIIGAHNHYVNFDSRRTVMASASIIQLTRPSITPVIMVGPMESPQGGDSKTFFGALPGAPEPATVGTAAAMVDLFNSNAALAGGTLVDPKNAVLYEAYVKGLFGSSKTATVPTFQRGYRTGKQAANLVGLSLAERLRPTDADRVRYGFTANAPSKVAELRDRLITTAKALALGLTSQVVIKYFDDDPHDIFTSGGNGGVNAATAAACMSSFLNAFMDDLMAVPDPFCPGIKLGDNTVVAFIGDTPRTMILRDNWNDPTVGGQNRAWIMSNGLLKTGFFGGERSVTAGQGAATNDHLARGPGEGGLFDPRTGDLIPFDPTGATGNIGGSQLMRKQAGEIAMASILYAVARGDIRTVQNFYSGPDFPAIQVPVII